MSSAHLCRGRDGVIFGRVIECNRTSAFGLGFVHAVFIVAVIIYCSIALSKYASCSLPVLFVFTVLYYIAVIKDSHILFLGVLFFAVMVQVCNVIGVCLCLRHFFMHLSAYVTSEATTPHRPLADGVVREECLWAGIILFVLLLWATHVFMLWYLSYWSYLNDMVQRHGAAPSGRDDPEMGSMSYVRSRPAEGPQGDGQRQLRLQKRSAHPNGTSGDGSSSRARKPASNASFQPDEEDKGRGVEVTKTRGGVIRIRAKDSEKKAERSDDEGSNF